MRPVSFLAIWMCWSAVSGFSEDRRPVAVVELFTSEGCSSCPPADEMLDRLQRTMPGVEVIALEEHVDYWNNLGWKDRFSAPIFHSRQNDYAQVFESDSIYTPQMVVNGHVQFVADDPVRAVYEIKRAAVTSEYGLRIQPQRNAKDPALTDLTIYVKSVRQNKPEPANVFLAISETKLTTSVEHGENAGRTLRHGPVVRSFGVIGNIAPTQFNEVGLKSTLKLPNDWNPEHLRAVVFVQERKSRQITAAAAVPLNH